MKEIAIYFMIFLVAQLVLGLVVTLCIKKWGIYG